MYTIAAHAEVSTLSAGSDGVNVTAHDDSLKHAASLAVARLGNTNNYNRFAIK
jgi:hypothetical protein